MLTGTKLKVLQVMKLIPGFLAPLFVTILGSVAVVTSLCASAILIDCFATPGESVWDLVIVVAAVGALLYGIILGWCAYKLYRYLRRTDDGKT